MKRLISLLTVSAMLLSTLTACGSSDKSGASLDGEHPFARKNGGKFASGNQEYIISVDGSDYKIYADIKGERVLFSAGKLKNVTDDTLEVVPDDMNAEQVEKFYKAIDAEPIDGEISDEEVREFNEKLVEEFFAGKQSYKLNDDGSIYLSKPVDQIEETQVRSMNATAKSLSHAVDAAFTDADAKGNFDLSESILITSDGYTNCEDNELYNYLMKCIENYFDAVNKLDYVIFAEKGVCMYVAASKDGGPVGVYSLDSCSYTFSGETISEIAEDAKSKIS